MNSLLKKNEKFVYVALYILCFLVSIVFLFGYTKTFDPNLFDVDETYYYTQAMKMVEGDYTINFYRPIGYPAFLALILYLSHSNIAIAKILLIAIAAFRGPLLYRFVKKMTGIRTIGLIAALIIAVWPTIVYFSTTVYTESISLTFFLLFLNVLPFGNRETNNRQWIAAGLILGLLVMIHPGYLMFLWLIFFIIFFEGVYFKDILKHTAMVIFSALIVILPWSIVISKHEGQFVLLSANSADALAGGLNSKLIDDGVTIIKAPNGRVTWTGPGQWIPGHGYLTPEEDNLHPAERNDLLFGRVVEWVKTHPGDTLYLEWAKLANLWGFWPLLPQIKSRFYFGNIPILIFLFLGLYAFYKWRDRIFNLSRIWIVMIYVSLVALASCGSWRYRAPADAMLIALTSLLIYSWFTQDDIPIQEKETKWK